jgi:hypothetical protein
MMIDAAIAYRRRGFSVIPIKPKGKKPLVAWESYQNDPASEETIRKWFASWPDANVAVVTGQISDVVVIDLDSEEAKAKIKALVPDYDLSAVPRVRTGRGGYHLFFKYPGVGVQTRAGVLPKTDIRADGGYVVTAPSVHESGKTYAWEVSISSELPKLPVEIFKLISSSANSTGYRERFNTPQALNGVPEGERDSTLFRLACKLRSADVPHDIAQTLLLEAAKNCDPPFSESVALEKVSRAYSRYNPNGNGTRPQSEKQPDFRLQFLSMKELLHLPPDPTRWLWDQTLPAAGASVLVSKPKIGKSTFAANLALAIARGIPFLGRNTQQSPVAYLSLYASLPEMIEAFSPFGPREMDPIFIHAGAAPKEAVAEIMQWVKANEARFIIVDTLQRLFRFQNVNDYSEVSNGLEPLTEAAREQKCHVMFLHHAKKDAGDDLDSAIGSTAIRGLAYSYLHMKRLPNSERRILRSDQRGGENISEMAIGFDRVTGWLEIQGTMEDAEVESVEPGIFEFVEAEGGDVSEKAIKGAMQPVRAMIISKAIRKLFKDGRLERTGKGRKGSPFLYSMAISLDSIPGLGGMGGRGTGIESEKRKKPLRNLKNSIPKRSGKERE